MPVMSSDPTVLRAAGQSFRFAPPEAILNSRLTNLPLIDAALFSVDRLGRRLVEFRARKNAQPAGLSS
jgi:hypothetical protein